jgi:exodeoxyribonuclease VII large subunit
MDRLAGVMGERMRMVGQRLAVAESDLRPVDLQRRLETCRGSVDSLHSQLTQLNPLNVLERGYAIVQDGEGRVVKDASQANVGAPLRVRVARGAFNVFVEDPRI